ncbi:hypothetical protein Cantr_03542 [Candida viswanathii]|uniref:Uncharacterized protein n=1 Tax=Candida viswanathii TaxID=5486 RepID=A0A367YLA1_9ASCO|nr:hypothetical protein Cantr_03542 [Candida viswanathii]
MNKNLGNYKYNAAFLVITTKEAFRISQETDYQGLAAVANKTEGDRLKPADADISIRDDSNLNNNNHDDGDDGDDDDDDDNDLVIHHVKVRNTVIDDDDDDDIPDFEDINSAFEENGKGNDSPLDLEDLPDFEDLPEESEEPPLFLDSEPSTQQTESPKALSDVPLAEIKPSTTAPTAADDVDDFDLPDFGTSRRKVTRQRIQKPTNDKLPDQLAHAANPQPHPNKHKHKHNHNLHRNCIHHLNSGTHEVYRPTVSARSSSNSTPCPNSYVSRDPRFSRRGFTNEAPRPRSKVERELIDDKKHKRKREDINLLADESSTSKHKHIDNEPPAIPQFIGPDTFMLKIAGEDPCEEVKVYTPVNSSTDVPTMVIRKTMDVRRSK